MPRAMKLLSVLLLGAGLAGCGEDRSAADAAARDSLTKRQRDSTLAESRVPNAKAVGKALETSDAAAARAAQLDSIR